MRVGNATWACDLCGVEKEIPAKSDRHPVGWSRIEVGLHRVLCPECMKAFTRWWYSAKERVSC